ncbi:hypothetical protein C2S53_019390 [Perilla frutescens var. hirtella]|uniref:Uncharacterized protein n=1 Tax=Perilla frutescens var. hirtella TaxID=608512 RepID=A0AAD4JL07_PERFH|nr:hypothetical protein C2S53_019390 [Perilla frutescens var. hirtella]
MAAVEGDEIAPRGNEWEVVSLTASAYAAAPGRQQSDMSHDSQGNLGGENKVEASNPMFMSSHFVFPPSQHENLPLEPEYSEINDDMGDEFQEGGKSDVKDEENVKIEELMFDERGNSLSDSSAKFQKEKSVSSSAEFQSSHFEATMDKFNTVMDGELTGDIPLPQDGASDSGFLNLEKSTDGENYDCSDLPCEAWWKRRAITLYSQAKETNTFWSIFIAAAVMGLVIIGHRWHQERRQGLNLKWSDQRMRGMFGPVSRVKM